MDSQPQVAASTPLSEARQLAHLLGIREDDPQAYLRDSQREKLIEAQPVMARMSETAKAQFCAGYLPAFVRMMRQSVRHEAGTTEYGLLSLALALLISQPLFHGHFLRSSSEAGYLLDTHVRMLLRLGPTLPQQTSATAVGLVMARQHLATIHFVIIEALRHGSACKVDLLLPADLGAKFLSHCRTQLASLRNLWTTDDHGQEVLMDVERYLQDLPIYLGVSAEAEVVLTRQVKTNASSPGNLRCELSTVPEDEWEPDGTDECSKLAGKKGELMFCSKCKSVAYCSAEHQRADWKKHKKVCFAPSW